jgi:hypothetical protein
MRVVFDGKYRVFLCDAGSITDPAAPTVADISAGDDVTKFWPKDAIDFGGQQGRVDGGDISTIFRAESMGTYGMSPTIQWFLDDDATENVAWNVLADQPVKDLVILPFAGQDGPADGDAAYVFPFAEFGQRIPNSPAENQRQRFTTEVALHEEPTLDGVVVSGA